MTDLAASVIRKLGSTVYLIAAYGHRVDVDMRKMDPLSESYVIRVFAAQQQVYTIFVEECEGGHLARGVADFVALRAVGLGDVAERIEATTVEAV